MQIEVPYSSILHKIFNKYQYTQHSDIFATIFDYMKLNIPYQKFSTGKSLLQYNKNIDYVTSTIGIMGKTNRFKRVLITNGYKIFYDDKGKININKVTDENDTILNDKHYLHSNFHKFLPKFQIPTSTNTYKCK